MTRTQDPAKLTVGGDRAVRFTKSPAAPCPTMGNGHHITDTGEMP